MALQLATNYQATRFWYNMAIFNIFSKRAKASSRNKDVYQYTVIPNPLRVQIVHIWNEVLGRPGERYDYGKEVYEYVNGLLCKEYGVFTLTNDRDSAFASVVKFFLSTDETNQALDVIETMFKMFDQVVRNEPQKHQINHGTVDEAISELNERFREHAVGFQFESGQIIRIDSQIIHAEVVKPALSLLSHKEFKGANQEFLNAHSHYRDAKYKECLNECLKAFESTLKIICTKHRWSFKPTDTANTLLGVVFSNNLIPPFMQNHFTGLRTSLEGGVPTARNKLSGHGQGAELQDVPEYLAAYVLHLTASNILFLVRASEELS